jgi:hypothetical protein
MNNMFIKLTDKNLWIYFTEEPRYKDLVIGDDSGNTMVIPTETLLNLIKTFANHLSTQNPTQDVSNISSRKSQVPESGS